MIKNFDEYLNENKKEYKIEDFGFVKSDKNKYYFDSTKHKIDGTLYLDSNHFGKGQGQLPYVDYIEFDSDTPYDIQEIIEDFFADELGYIIKHAKK